MQPAAPLRRLAALAVVCALLAVAVVAAVASSSSSTSASASAHARAPRVHAATVDRPTDQVTVPRWAIELAAKHRDRAGKPARPGSHRRAADYRMPARDVRRLLRMTWAAFGYRGRPLEKRVNRNAAQIERESADRPAVMQGFIGDVNDHNPAGGLMQFIPGTFHHWQVGHRGDRFNPLDNILAAVNAQAHGATPILDGSSGWSPPMRHNPLRGRAVRVS